MRGTVASKWSNDRWVNLLIWAVLIWLAWRLFLLLAVRPAWSDSDHPSAPTNPRQLSQMQTQRKLNEHQD